MANRRDQYRDMNRYRETCNNQKKRYYSKTAIYGGKRKYTDDEDMAILDHAITDTELSSIIKRSVKSIQIRRSRLKKSQEQGLI